MRSGYTCMPSTIDRELHEHVVGERARVGEDHPLDRRVRDVALVPQRDVLEPGAEVPAQHPRQPAELLALHRVALVRHRRGALLLPGPERLLHLAHLGALQVADLRRELLDARADARARVEQLRVPVAREHLRRGHRREAELRADVLLDERVDVRVRADRAGELADRDHLAWPGAAARCRGGSAAPRARASRRTSSARRGCRACARPSACRGTRAPAW